MDHTCPVHRYDVPLIPPNIFLVRVLWNLID